MAATESTKYEVAAHLRLKGNFAQQMRRQTAAVPKLDASLRRAQQNATRFGHSLMRGPVEAMSRMVKLSAILAGVGGALAMKGLVGGGIAFNKQMEDARLNLSTMFQMFGIADGVIGKGASQTEKWATNMDIARAAMKEFMVLQAQTPAGAQDLVRIYQASAAGLAQANKNVAKHTQFVAEWSVLAGALQGDMQQLGADLGRMLTGQAGAELRTWQIFKSNILESAKAAGLVSKNMQMGDKWVKSWNMNFTADERFKVLQNMIGKAGPELRKAFGESMGGLLSTTRATMNSLKGVLTIPMYNEFRLFLKRITQETSGVFGTEAMRDWVKILSFFGGMLGGLAGRWLSALENGAIHLRENWQEVADSVYKAFQAGALLLKAILAAALTKFAIGVGARVVGAGLGAAGGGIRGARKVGGMFARTNVGMRKGVRRGFFGGGRGMTGMLGGGLAKLMGLFGKNAEGGAKFATTLISVGAALATTAVIALPLIAAVAAVGFAFGIVGIIVAGMAAYVIENWRMISSEIFQAMKAGRVNIHAVLVAAFKLWNGLKAIGAMFLGNGKSVGFMNSMLGFMFDTIKLVTESIIFFLDVGRSLSSFWGDFANMMARMFESLARFEDFGARFGLSEGGDVFWKKAKAWKESVQGADAMTQKLGDIKRQFEHFKALGLPDVDLKAAKDMEKTIQDFFDPKGKGKKPKVPVSGVHVENMYNQWDLRNTDPDRLMGAFLPKLEQLADKRVQSWEALDQGV